jgi:hypothetical protein
MLYASWYGCAPAIRWGAFPYLYNLHNAQSRLEPFALKAVRLAFYTSSRQRNSGQPVAEAVVDSSMSGCRPHPIVIDEMFRKLVSRLGRAVTAGIKPPHVCLTNTCDLLQVAGRRPDRLATPPSTDSAP